MGDDEPHVGGDRRRLPDRRKPGPVTPKAAILSAAAIIGALLAIWQTAPELWESLGWVTPAEAGRAHGIIERRFQTSEEGLEEKLSTIEDLIICDKYDAELETLLAAQQAGDDRVQTAERISRLRELRRRRDCARFDE